MNELVASLRNRESVAFPHTLQLAPVLQVNLSYSF